VDRYNLKAFEIRGGNDAATDQLTLSGFEAFMYAQPHNGEQYGGDLRFVSACAMGQIVRFTLADIAGHGEEAGEMALRLKALIRKHMNTPNPTKFACALNKELGKLKSGGKFATAVITTYFAPTDHLIVCNAGHPRPLLFHAATVDATRDQARRWELFDQNSTCAIAPENAKATGISNLPLGIVPQTNYPQFATRLVEGDIVVSYTDAFIESTDPSGAPLGEEGLLETVRRLDMSKLRPDEIGPAILSAVAAFRGGKPADDDQTLIVLYHTATNPPDGPFARLKAIARIAGLVH
jgi:serine phosphatase RsbU (regulator of sigma subunit)